MGKNIVLCSDGTGNTAIKGRGTNVFKIYEAVDLNHEQIKQCSFYDDGVGSGGLKLIKIFGGAFGFGLSRNVRQLYCELARLYKPDDNIYLFGFSRGAFTVRALAGFINHCGVLDTQYCRNDQALIKLVKGAYKAYRHNYETFATRLWRRMFKSLTLKKYGFTTVEEFKQYTHDGGTTPIHFIGVWDTVSAVGFPVMGVSNLLNKIYRFKFPDNKPGNVRFAYQSLALDEKRKTFSPELWDETPVKDTQEIINKPIIQQVWFAGVHSNVGGGYPKQGMSLVSLHWMMEKAHDAGLQFLEEDRRIYQGHANANGKLYDSRAGWAVYYRYEPRNIGELCDAKKVKPLIHESVLQRSLLVSEGYAPGNIPSNACFVSSKGDSFVREEERILHAKFLEEEGKNCLLEKVQPLIKRRQRLHGLFLALSVIFLGVVISEYKLPTAVAMFSDLGLFAKVALNTLWLVIPIITVLLIGNQARKQIQNVFSSFWYKFNRAMQTKGKPPAPEKAQAAAVRPADAAGTPG